MEKRFRIQQEASQLGKVFGLNMQKHEIGIDEYELSYILSVNYKDLNGNIHINVTFLG